MLIFRGVGFSIKLASRGEDQILLLLRRTTSSIMKCWYGENPIPWIIGIRYPTVRVGQMGKTKHLPTLFWRTQEYPTQPFGDTRSDEVIICSCHWSFDHARYTGPSSGSWNYVNNFLVLGNEMEKLLAMSWCSRIYQYQIWNMVD